LPELDLELSLHALSRDVALVVPSCVGFSMTVVLELQPVTLTSMSVDADAAPICSTLTLPLTLTSQLAPGSTLVFYAHALGAFVDLAADLTIALGARDGQVVADDRPIPVRSSGIVGVEQLTIVNRAVGLLVGRGSSVADAHAQLQGTALRSGLQSFQVAAYLVSMTE
jgi:hypothetical protein